MSTSAELRVGATPAGYTRDPQEEAPGVSDFSATCDSAACQVCWVDRVPAGTAGASIVVGGVLQRVLRWVSALSTSVMKAAMCPAPCADTSDSKWRVNS